MKNSKKKGPSIMSILKLVVYELAILGLMFAAIFKWVAPALMGGA